MEPQFALGHIPMRNVYRCGFVLCSVVFLCNFWVASLASASELSLCVDFGALPVSATMPELVWYGGSLSAGTGSIGTGYDKTGPGDGEELASDQRPGGLLVQTSCIVNREISGRRVNTPAGTTAFYDATMVLTGLAEDGPAEKYPSRGKITFLQYLTTGTFSIYSNDDPNDTAETCTLLLYGTISDAVISGTVGSAAGAVWATVNYTDGAILDALGGTPMTGELSWDIMLLSGERFGTIPNDAILPDFNANATGQFVTMPEPGTFVLLSIGSIFGLAVFASRKCRNLNAAFAA